MAQQRIGIEKKQDFQEWRMSDEFCEAGFVRYNEGDLFGAIVQYNKALVYARKDKLRTSLIYGNRSAVFLKLEYFRHCIFNIKIAHQHFPRDKIQILYDRRQQCLQKMEIVSDKAMQAFDHTFKLSYERNPKLPFFIKAIQLKTDQKFGKHLITTIDLYAGDVIAVIDNLWRFPINDFSGDFILACYNCPNVNNGDLISGHCKAMFCSDACKANHLKNDADHDVVHKIQNLFFECRGDDAAKQIVMDYAVIIKILLKLLSDFNSIEAMRKFVESRVKNKRYDIFDFDWSRDEGSIRRMLMVIMGVSIKDKNAVESDIKKFNDDISINIRYFTNKNFNNNDRIWNIFSDGNSEDQQFLDKLIHQINCAHEIRKMQVSFRNGQQYGIASYTHPAMYLLNDSCDPNIMMHIDTGGKSIWTVNQPINAGSQIFYLYDTSTLYSNSKRTKDCPYKETCVPCKNEWNKKIDGKKVEIDCQKSLFCFFLQNDPWLLSSLLKQRNECCEFINNNFNGYDEKPEKRQFIAAKKEELACLCCRITSVISVN